MTELCKLAQKHGTDKFPYYTPFYDLILNSRREAVKSVLEIGIGTTASMSHVDNYKPGASLRMWREYFPLAKIWGLDKDPSVMISEPRISCATGDQSDPEALAMVYRLGELDLIVDDGSHDPAHQSLSLNCLWHYLAPGGIYIIEDCKFPHMVHALDNLDHAEIAINSKDKPTAYCVVLRKD
jgi:8-demethyl-8-alpha-L-rhamnosyltetracenomycin-C 2'-O-methyltransferase